jgi:hypothetical protein
MLAAPGSEAQGQDRPGQISQAKVWIENRGPNEAVPVILQEVMTPTPIGVQVIGTPMVTIPPATTVQARLVRQQWEYRTINIPSGQEAAGVLSAAGADGWEATGIVLSNQSGSPVVLKRPKS